MTFKKLKFYFSCFHLCLKEVRHIGILLPVSHICLQIAFPVSHIGFTISYNFSNLMLHWKRRLLCSWITTTLIWYIGSYMLLPIDFNGKLEIFLKHFKKKKIFFFGLHVWVIGLWLFFRYSYFRFKPCQLCFFFKKKKIFFFFCSWTSTQITLKFFQHVSAMLNFKFFFFGPAMCWHVTLTLTLINPHLEWMWCEFEFYLTLNMLGWTLVILIEIYFISFGYTPIVI